MYLDGVELEKLEEPKFPKVGKILVWWSKKQIIIIIIFFIEAQ